MWILIYVFKLRLFNPDKEQYTRALKRFIRKLKSPKKLNDADPQVKQVVDDIIKGTSKSMHTPSLIDQHTTSLIALLAAEVKIANKVPSRFSNWLVVLTR